MTPYKSLILIVMDPLTLVPDSLLYEQYSDPRSGIEDMAKMYGVSVGSIYARLQQNIAAFARAQEVKAYRLHDLSVRTLFEEPERIIDAAGCERIDPAAVTLQKYRSSEAARIAGILHAKLADRHQVEVTHNNTPLADFIASIAAKGSSVPIAPPVIVEGETFDIPLRVEHAVENVEDSDGGIPLE